MLRIIRMTAKLFSTNLILSNLFKKTKRDIHLTLQKLAKYVQGK